MNVTDPADLTKQWAQTRLAHEAVMLKDAAGVLAEQREAVRAHREQAGGKTDRPEEMGDITIGDQIHYHQAAPPAASPNPAPTAAASGLSNLARAGILAAAMATGGLPAAGLTYLLTASQQPQETVSAETPPPPVTTVPTIPDQIDWALDLLPPE
jgi:hypothetical protein